MLQIPLGCTLAQQFKNLQTTVTLMAIGKPIPCSWRKVYYFFKHFCLRIYSSLRQITQNLIEQFK